MYSNKSHHHHQANKLWGHTARLGEDNEAVCETRLQLHNKISKPREQCWTNPVSQRGVTGHFTFRNYSVSMIIQRVFFNAPQSYRQQFLWQDGQILECVDWPVSDWALKLRAVSFTPIIEWFCLKSNLFYSNWFDVTSLFTITACQVPVSHFSSRKKWHRKRFLGSHVNMLPLEIIIDLPIGFPINNIISLGITRSKSGNMSTGECLTTTTQHKVVSQSVIERGPMGRALPGHPVQ